MSQTTRMPPLATVIRTYSELARFAQAFSAGHLRFVIVLGAGGLGKSRCLRDALGEDAHWIEGNATAFGLFLDAYENRDRPIVLDDVDGILRQPNGVRLLKSLCQTEPVKTLSWTSSTQILEQRGIPNRFATSSPVALIANSWGPDNPNIAALEDRGHVVVFAPDALEIHQNAATWFHDQQVFDFVAEQLHMLDHHSLRLYVLAAEEKQAGLDWRRFILGRGLADGELEVARLRANPDFSSENARAQAFIDAGHGCRSTYFNYARRNPRPLDVPQFDLARARRDTDTDGPEPGRRSRGLRFD
jgi:hypothetical protein